MTHNTNPNGNTSPSKIRRSRGYSFETYLVKRFIDCGWGARRLGGVSTGLPDVVAVNNSTSTLYAIEAKSKRENSVEVPGDEIHRCIGIVDMFSLYKHRKAIVATRLGDNRKPVYRYWPVGRNPTIYKAIARLNNIEIFGKVVDKPFSVVLKDQIKMPWQD